MESGEESANSGTRSAVSRQDQDTTAVPVRADLAPSSNDQQDVPRSPVGRTSRDRGDSHASRNTIVDEDFRSPQRTTTGLSQFPALDGTTSGLRRRATARSSIRSRRPRRSTAGQTNAKFTLAGPTDDATQLRAAHENFVHPGYADLNPAYEQPASAKPVWSLAKPLPRVIRPGMVPTKSEILESRANAELPAEHSQKLGLDVDPNDLDLGKISLAPPKQLAAQLKDSRAQRENAFISSGLRRSSTTNFGAGSGGLSRVDTSGSRSAVRRPRASTGASRRTRWDDIPEETPARTSLEVPQQDDGHDLKSPSPLRKHDLDPIPENQSPQELDEDDEEDRNEEQYDVDTASTLDLNTDPAILADMDPLLGNQLEDEIHNNHTAWSVVRTQHREFLAEFLAVFIQLTIGFSADLSVTVAQAGNPNTTDWAWGFATMIGIYISGGISGAHLNPSITTMLWFFRGFPKRKMPEYFLAQLLGAFVATFTAYGLYLASIQHYLASNPQTSIITSFVTSQRSGYIDTATAFFNEFVGTAFLSATVLALGDDQNAPPGAGMNSLIIGLVITALSMAFANQTGAALNPSRDLGPRLALLALGYRDVGTAGQDGGTGLFSNPYWFYGPVAGTLLGAFMGAFLYDAAIFTGGESPVNYPWTRTKRSFRKGKKKWARRLHLNKKKVGSEEEGGRDAFGNYGGARGDPGNGGMDVNGGHGKDW